MPALPELRFDTYHRYPELTALLQGLADAHPDTMELRSLGSSYEGRDIWLAIVTRRSTGPHQHKPAVWVDGNIHSTELSACSACLYLLAHLLGRDGLDPDVTEVLDTRTFYVVPRVNPDGPELVLSERPVHLRSSVRPYPFDEEPVEGLRVEDIDRDGRILSMRFLDPNGPWKVCERDPRLLVRREPGDREGPFFRVVPEGRMLPGWDRTTIREAPYKHRLDLNRNFPAFWRTEHEQQGAGPYPTSEPEVRALVAFIASHPNICHALTFHTYSGVLLRPYSTDSDERFPAEDLRMFRHIGKKGEQITGYPAVSVYHDFRYHPKTVITGGFDDWMYEHLGAFAWTVELWSPFRQAGITRGFEVGTKSGDFRFIEWPHDHPLEEDLALLRWSDEKLGGRGYIDWYDYEHPEMGRVQLGGWDFMLAFRNPPPEYLEAELEPFPRWLIWQALSTPLLGLREEAVIELGGGHYELRLVVENRGWLPSYVTKLALERNYCRELVAELKLPQGVELVSGKLRTFAGQLEGIAYKPLSPVVKPGDYSQDRVLLTWVLKSPGQASVGVVLRHDRAGRIDRVYRLG
ncbi:MAG: carboxypeptidase [Armatimonadetes bacterium]|nr:carboxypeptidase [Armatimonadota bacterium]